MDAKPIGRPKTATLEKKASDNRARQAKFRRKQRLVKLIAEKLIKLKDNERGVWLEFLAYAMACGNNHYVSVEWERGGSTAYFSEIAQELLGETPSKFSYGSILSIKFIN